MGWNHRKSENIKLSLLQKYGRALITRLTFQTPVILTGLNNVCACLRSQGSYWCERSGHHNKAWKNRSILYSARFVLKSIIKLKTIKRNLIYSSSLNHWPTLLVHWSLKVEQLLLVKIVYKHSSNATNRPSNSNSCTQTEQWPHQTASKKPRHVSPACVQIQNPKLQIQSKTQCKMSSPKSSINLICV